MTMQSVTPGESPVSLNEARGWLRLGPTIDDAVVAGLVRAATNICEAFVGQWLIERAAAEVLPINGAPLVPRVRPVVAVDAVALIAADGSEAALAAEAWDAAIGRDGTARVTLHQTGGAVRARASYRAGLAAEANGIPEAIRQGIVRMTQHLHDARDGAPATPPAAIAALWQPWRRMTLGGAA